MATAKKSTPSIATDDGSLAMAGGAAAGAAAGSFLGPLGAAVGAVMGGVAGARTERKDVAKAVQTVKSAATSRPVRQAASTVVRKIGAIPASMTSLMKTRPQKKKKAKSKKTRAHPARAKAAGRSTKPMRSGRK